MKLSLILLFCISLPVLAGSIKDGTLQATSDGDNITIQWQSADESSVTSYDIERRNGISGDFIPIATLSKKGSDYSFYQYVDKTAFKTTGSIYQYRIKINPSGEYSSVITVSHNVSGVKRTWGSLKAMFR